eukprot:scaffold28816_cov67-Phaeocystis_antarctica.AAC.5
MARPFFSTAGIVDVYWIKTPGPQNTSTAACFVDVMDYSSRVVTPPNTTSLVRRSIDAHILAVQAETEIGSSATYECSFPRQFSEAATRNARQVARPPCRNAV